MPASGTVSQEEVTSCFILLSEGSAERAALVDRCVGVNKLLSKSLPVDHCYLLGSDFSTTNIRKARESLILSWLYGFLRTSVLCQGFWVRISRYLISSIYISKKAKEFKLPNLCSNGNVQWCQTRVRPHTELEWYMHVSHSGVSYSALKQFAEIYKRKTYFDKVDGEFFELFHWFMISFT